MPLNVFDGAGIITTLGWLQVTWLIGLAVLTVFMSKPKIIFSSAFQWQRQTELKLKGSVKEGVVAIMDGPNRVVGIEALLRGTAERLQIQTIDGREAGSFAQSMRPLEELLVSNNPQLKKLDDLQRIAHVILQQS